MVAEWTSEIASPETIRVDGRTFLTFRLEDDVYDAPLGAPSVPTVATFIALPPGMTASIEADPPVYRRIGGLLAPMPTPMLRENSSRDRAGNYLGYHDSYRMDADAYRSYQPDKIGRLEPATDIGGVSLVRLVVAPIRFNPGAGEIALADRVVVRVRFAGQLSPWPGGRGLPSFWNEAVLNADQAATWKRARSVDARLGRRATSHSPSPFADGVWMRIVTKNQGIYRLKAQSVASADERFQDASMEHLTVFTGTGEELPHSPTATRLESPRPVGSIANDVNGDGLFNGDDELLFYNPSTSHWRQSTNLAKMLPDYHMNRYTTEQVFWLALVDTVVHRSSSRDGRVSNTSLPVVDRFLCSTHEEPELRNFDEQYDASYLTDGDESGLDWEWDKLSVGTSLSLQPILHSVASDSIWMRVAALLCENRLDTIHRFPIEEVMPDVTIDGDTVEVDHIESTSAYTRRYTYAKHSVSVVDGQSTPLPIRIGNAERTDPDPRGIYAMHLDYYEIHYWRRFDATGGGELPFSLQPLLLDLPDQPVQISMKGVDRSKHRLFDITDNGFAEITLPASESDGTTRIELLRSDYVSRQHLLTSSEHWREPTRLEPAIAGSDLRSARGGIDYLVISHPDFLEPAQLLANHRSDPQGDGFRTAVVSTSDIYDQFAFGMFDPAAIRDFIKHVAENWISYPDDLGLQYVVLMGDGQYDFRNLTRFAQADAGPNPGNWVPPYELGDIATDDWYVSIAYRNQKAWPEIQLGRLPVQTLTDAQQVVDKLILYDKEPERGPWQNKVLLVSDDEFNPDAFSSRENFVWPNEDLIEYLRPETVVEKIYGIEYSKDQQGQKPNAAKAIIDAWNVGAMLINYVGHGSPVVWSHERMYQHSRDLSMLANGKRQPVLVALTCSAAHFDDPEQQSMVEDMLALTAGGIIAGVATTRLAYNAQNIDFGRPFVNNLFRVRSSETIRSQRIGDAFWAAKAVALLSHTTNTHKFILLGDPATRVVLPELPLQVQLDSDTLIALSATTISGQVLLPDQSGTLTSFNGQALVHLFDSSTPAAYRLNGGYLITYERTGSAMFRGVAPVSKGLFDIKAIIPREVIYGGTDARAVVQIWNDQIDGAGIQSGIPIHPSSRTDVQDTDGPLITFSTAGDLDQPEPLTDGMEIAQNDPVRIWIADPAGINVTGEIGHRLLAYPDDDAEPIDITERFTHWESATSGWADVNLPSG